MLAVSLALALILRLFNLNSLPIGFTADEAAFGYNAFTLLSTGRDEWGIEAHKLAFTNLRSFGDYKLPLYSFLAVPSVKFLGLNEFSVRLPNAVLGSLSVLSVYLLAYRLYGRLPANLAAFFFSLSPWGIQLSRGAFEANLFVFFIPLAVYAFTSGRLSSSLLMFLLAFYSYHTARYLLPLVLAVLFVYQRPRLSFNNIAAFSLFFALLLPGLYSMAGPGSSRASDIGVFSPTDNWESVSSRRFDARQFGFPDALARVFSNKLLYVGSEFIKAYLTYLSPYFLFVQGAGETTYGMIPGRGVLYYLDAPLLMGFLVMLARGPRRAHFLLLALLLLVPLPASLAKSQGLAANRAVSLLPFLVTASAAGFNYLKTKLNFIRLSVTVVVAFYLLSFAFFFEDYVVHSPKKLARGMNFGMKEAVVRSKELAGPKPLFFGRNLSEPHIFAAFYGQIEPTIYQKDINRYADFQIRGFKYLDQLGYYSISDYGFGDLPLGGFTEPTILVGRTSDFPENVPAHFYIDYPDGSRAIKVAEIKP